MHLRLAPGFPEFLRSIFLGSDLLDFCLLRLTGVKVSISELPTAVLWNHGL